MKKVAVIQSNYLPWKGYFDIIHDVDLFIFYDDVQFTKNDWRNRNKVKTAQGTAWITIPVGDDENRTINQVRPLNNLWREKHWKTLKQYYSKAPHFRDYAGFFESFYMGTQGSSLSEINHFLTQKIAKDFLGVTTEFRDSTEYSPEGNKQDRLLDLLKKTGAELYVSGGAARDYITDADFEQAGIKLVYKDYSGYPEYPQFFPPFTHFVTVLDLLFHAGPDAPYFIWGWREKGIGSAHFPVISGTDC